MSLILSEGKLRCRNWRRGRLRLLASVAATGLTAVAPEEEGVGREAVGQVVRGAAKEGRVDAGVMKGFEDPGRERTLEEAATEIGVPETVVAMDGAITDCTKGGRKFESALPAAKEVEAAELRGIFEVACVSEGVERLGAVGGRGEELDPA